MLIRSLPPEERPLEKAELHGINSLSSSELLALILRTGAKNVSAVTLASDIVAACENGLGDLASMDFSDLTGIRGIGRAKAGAVLAAVELGKRISMSRRLGNHVISCSQDAAHVFMEKLRYEKKEHFYSVPLSTKGEMLGMGEVSMGDLSGTIVNPREVFTEAVRKSAASVVFIHNHPSGDPTPSRQDRSITDRLVWAGTILGIEVLDHIIIGDGIYCSFRALGYMNGA